MNLVGVLLFVLVCGVLARLVKLPPMIGFLVAGFVLQAMFTGILPAPSTMVGQSIPWLNQVADTGVTLLLFTIGLKLDLKSLLRPEILGTAVAHMGFSTVVWAALFWAMSFTGLALFDGAHTTTFLVLGFALAFSSTIFVVKTLDEHGETGSRFGSIAIGVLVIQDLAAAVFMAFAKGQMPSIWALVTLAAAVPARWIIFKALDHVGRGELLVVAGMALALGGYEAFDLVGLKGDLGAIMMGFMIAAHPRAKLMADRLFSLRELLLVGFFLSIGQYGLPDGSSLIVAGLLTLALPLQTLIYLLIFRFTRLRVRTAAKSSLLLTNYSEFGLIAGIVAVENQWIPEEWMVALAIAVTASFIAATVLDTNREKLVDLLCHLIPDLPTERLLPEERPINFKNVEAVVFGMGEFGTGAYAHLVEAYGKRVRGVEQNLLAVKRLCKEGFDVVEGDATDPSLWERIHGVHNVELVVLAMPDHDGNTGALRAIKESDIDAFVAVVAESKEQAAEFRELSADLVMEIYAGAGAEVVDESHRILQSTTK
ncbi:cation:proton antiporter family protein [Actinomyces vulturis]|uniref:cation:proton antiporter family protein n=1 Tax=Actinomyces vulturis TaxID=1857645 RepID=UPI00082C9730|nr:cation:proton antiporter family protein [Actinomyces vulturis]